MASSLRPKGTVEVMCEHPGCGVAWWLDPLDPLLPNGPFNCGAKHDLERVVDLALTRLRLETGIAWGSLRYLKPDGDPEGNSSADPSRGIVLFHNRTRSEHGYFRWESLDGFDPRSILKRIVWHPEKWPLEIFLTPDPLLPPHGFVHTVNYQLTDGSIRRYTFSPCTRPSCGHRVMVDYDRPDFKAEGYTIGGLGGDVLPEPKWWPNRSFRCGETLSTFSPVPCHIVTGAVLSEVEYSQSIRWTMWESVGTSGKILFRDPDKDRFGFLMYEDEGLFRSPEAVQKSIVWGTLPDLHSRMNFASYSEIESQVRKCVDARQ